MKKLGRPEIFSTKIYSQGHSATEEKSTMIMQPARTFLLLMCQLMTNLAHGLRR